MKENEITRFDTPAKLRAEGERIANGNTWGEYPPHWNTALVQADWEAEAVLLEKEMKNGKDEDTSNS